jgi:hypothetical protein
MTGRFGSGNNDGDTRTNVSSGRPTQLQNGDSRQTPKSGYVKESQQEEVVTLDRKALSVVRHEVALPKCW